MKEEIEALNAELAKGDPGAGLFGSIERREPGDDPTVRRDRRATIELREELDRLTASRNATTDALGRISDEQRRRIVVEEEVQKVVERTIELTEDEIKEKERRAAAVRDIVAQLQMEKLGLEEGEAAVLDKQLADLDATDAVREHALVLFEEIRALNEEQRAVREAAREKDRAAQAEVRRLEALKRARQRENKAASDRLARQEQARLTATLNAELREAQDIAQETAAIIGNAFDEIIGRTESVADAFGDMVTEILAQIQRLLIQRAIVEPIIGAISGALFPGATTGTQVSAGVAALGTEFANKGIVNFTGGVSAFRAQPAGPTTIVEQSLTFAPSFIDGADGARWLRQNAGEIMGIVGEGAQRSTAFAAAVRGERG